MESVLIRLMFRAVIDEGALKKVTFHPGLLLRKIFAITPATWSAAATRSSTFQTQGAFMETVRRAIGNKTEHDRVL